MKADQLCSSNLMLRNSTSRDEGDPAFSIERFDPASIDAPKRLDFVVDVLIESLLLFVAELENFSNAPASNQLPATVWAALLGAEHVVKGADGTAAVVTGLLHVLPHHG